MSGRQPRYAELTAQEVPHEREFQNRVAVHAGVRRLPFCVRRAKRADDQVIERLRHIDKIVGDTQFIAHEGRIGPTTAATVSAACDRDFHRDAEDVPARALQQISGNAAVHAAAHQDGNLLRRRLLRRPGRERRRQQPDIEL